MGSSAGLAGRDTEEMSDDFIFISSNLVDKISQKCNTSHQSRKCRLGTTREHLFSCETQQKLNKFEILKHESVMKLGLTVKWRVALHGNPRLEGAAAVSSTRSAARWTKY